MGSPRRSLAAPVERAGKPVTTVVLGGGGQPSATRQRTVVPAMLARVAVDLGFFLGFVDPVRLQLEPTALSACYVAAGSSHLSARGVGLPVDHLEACTQR